MPSSASPAEPIIFLCAVGCTRPAQLSINLAKTSVRELKVTGHRLAHPNADADSAEIAVEQVYLTCNGRLISDTAESLAEEGVVYGSIVRSHARLRGGALLNVKVKTRFGCLCCGNRLSCDCCNGRIYDVRVSSIQDVSTIIDGLAKQNEQWEATNPNKKLLNAKGAVLEEDRKILFYDIQDGDELTMFLQPFLWFKGDFRSGGRSKDEDEEEAELQRRIEAKKAAKDKGYMADPNAVDKEADVDVHTMAI